MAIEHEGNELLENEWTQIIVDKKNFWEEFASTRGYEIHGVFSNFKCEFRISIPTPIGNIQIDGERRFVDIPNTPFQSDFYRETFTLSFATSIQTAIPISKTISRGPRGIIQRTLRTKPHYYIDDSIALMCTNEADFRRLSDIGLFALKPIYDVETSSTSIHSQYDKLFSSQTEIEVVDRIIQRIQSLS